MAYPLWKAGGDNAWHPADLSSRSLGLDVVLCAPGPSLIPVERQSGVMVAALTKAYPTIRPDIWFGFDLPECYDRRLWSEPFVKIANGGLRQTMALDGQLLCYAPNVYFANVKRLQNIFDMFDDLVRPATFAWKQNSLATALHILLWQGARRIYLNGFDLRTVGGQDYHGEVGKVLPPELRRINETLFKQQIGFLVRSAAEMSKRGMRLVSVTPGSPLNNLIGYCDLADALTAARRQLPAPIPVKHCMELATARKARAAAVAIAAA